MRIAEIIPEGHAAKAPPRPSVARGAPETPPRPSVARGAAEASPGPPVGRTAPEPSPRAPARLVFERVGARTVVRSARPMGPLRLLTPKNHGHAAWVYATSLGGGFVDGDEVKLDVAVGPGAAAVLATQGATRVYRSVRGCRSDTNVEVSSGGLFVSLPDPTVCFAGARYVSRYDVRVASGGALVLVDALCAGRIYRGERWAFRSYASGIRLQICGRLALNETLLLDPEQGPIAERLGRFNLLATILLAGEPLAAVRDELSLRIGEQPLRPRASIVESKSALGEGALLVRIAAVATEDALCRIRSYLQFLPALLGDDPFSRRGTPCT